MTVKPKPYALTLETGERPHVIRRASGELVFACAERDLPLARTLLKRLHLPIEKLIRA